MNQWLWYQQLVFSLISVFGVWEHRTRLCQEEENHLQLILPPPFPPAVTDIFWVKLLPSLEGKSWLFRAFPKPSVQWHNSLWEEMVPNKCPASFPFDFTRMGSGFGGNVASSNKLPWKASPACDCCCSNTRSLLVVSGLLSEGKSCDAKPPGAVSSITQVNAHNTVDLCNHSTMEYLKLEGTHKDHWVQPLAPLGSTQHWNPMSESTSRTKMARLVKQYADHYRIVS